MNTSIPKPSKEFTEAGRQLNAILEAQEGSKRFKERRRLEGFLRSEFVRAFQFLPDRRKLAYHFYYRFINSPAGPQTHIFDHLDFFQRGATLVIVSQPYGIEEKELDRWTRECGATYTIANDWGYYFPGRASLFIVEFSEQAKGNLDKRVREHCR